MRHPYGRGNRAGFTLIEILVAVTMLVIVIGAIYGAFRAGNQSSVMIEEQSDLHQTARVLLWRISNELCSLYAPTSPDAITLEGDNSQEKGGPAHFDRLTFTTLSHKPCGAVDQRGDVCTVTYAAEASDDGTPLGLFVKEDYAPDLHATDTQADSLPETVVSTLVVGMDCSYLDPSTEEWVDQWTDQTTLPEAVRVQLTLKSPRKDSKPITVAMTTNLPLSAGAQSSDSSTTNSTGGSTGTTSPAGGGNRNGSN